MNSPYNAGTTRVLQYYYYTLQSFYFRDEKAQSGDTTWHLGHIGGREGKGTQVSRLPELAAPGKLLPIFSAAWDPLKSFSCGLYPFFHNRELCAAQCRYSIQARGERGESWKTEDKLPQALLLMRGPHFVLSLCRGMSWLIFNSPHPPPTKALCFPSDLPPSPQSAQGINTPSEYASHVNVHGILQARILEWGWSFSSSGDLPNPGTEPRSPVWQADSLPLSHLGSPMNDHTHVLTYRMRVTAMIPN